ncbi:MAG TPA: superoxide dismutase [Bacteroidia bacterium]|nr:superoxide dismutase [Bacteroidia bacterium]
MEHPRRDFIRISALLGLSGLASGMLGKENLGQLEQFTGALQDRPAFSLPPLPYAYNALEPMIDKETMTLHHDKHHQAYVDKLNKALENYKGSTALKALFLNVSTLDPSIRNNGGGHYNHSLFWVLMKAPVPNENNEATGQLYAAIKNTFGSFEKFRTEFSDQALKIFGSGWCWLIVDAEKKIQICTTPNQDNPLMDVARVKGIPVLALDVWEHAYYLKYQNKRVDYIKNWWSLVNWSRAEELYKEAMGS